MSKDETGLPSPRWLQFRTSNKSLQRAPKSEAAWGWGGQGLSMSPGAWCCGSLTILGYASIPLLGAQSKNLKGASDSPTSHRSANPVCSTFEILMCQNPTSPYLHCLPLVQPPCPPHLDNQSHLFSGLAVSTFAPHSPSEWGGS